MKKLFAAIAILAAAVFCGARAGAQEIITEEPAAARDTALVLKVPDAVDSTLIGLSIKDVIDINQSLATDEGLNMFIFRNQTRVQSGYRVRIFFDNKQSARAASEAAMEAFNKDFQGIPAYRTYQSPFFKVTVGDFRTKSEAMVLLRALKGQFPSAFIVKENINYPVRTTIPQP